MNPITEWSDTHPSPDPDGKNDCDSQEAQAVNAELDRKLREQPVWRRARVLYED